MSAKSDFSTQPPPRFANTEVSAHDLVVEDLLSIFATSVELDNAVSSVEARKAFGLSKYGTVLHADNGRDYLLDIEEELLDLVAYLRIFLQKHPDLFSVFGDDYKALLDFLFRLITYSRNSFSREDVVGD